MIMIRISEVDVVQLGNFSLEKAQVESLLSKMVSQGL
jgi:hypothetical protein